MLFMLFVIMLLTFCY